MNFRRPFVAVVAAWTFVLALLAWAVVPGAAFTPATAWTRDTFLVRMPGGELRWMSAPEAGYAAVEQGEGTLAVREGAGFRATEIDAELAGTDAARVVHAERVRAGDYTDLGR